MLLDELRKAIADMEEVRGLEQDSQDSEKQSRIDSLYAQEVVDHYKIINSIENSRKFVTFNPSSLLKEELLRLLGDSKSCIESGFAQENRLKVLQSNTKSIKAKFAAEWNDFYKNLSDKRLHTLTVIKEITPDKEKTGYTINKIKNGTVINYENDNKVRLLAEGIAEADHIFHLLGLEEENEIMVFLDKVADKTATMLDLTDTIIKWIEERNLTGKFFVRFGS